MLLHLNHRQYSLDSTKPDKHLGMHYASVMHNTEENRKTYVDYKSDENITLY